MAINNNGKTADENSVGQESFADEKDDFLDETDPEDALLLEALRRYDDEMLDKFFSENDDEKPVPLSCEGREKMEELLGEWLGPQKAQQVLKKEEKQYQQELRRWKQRRRRQMFSRVPRWCFAAAAALLAVIIGVVNPKTSLAFKLPEVGFEAVVGSERTRLKVQNESQLELFDGDVNVEYAYTISTCYKLGKILDGYILQDSIVNTTLCMYIYANKSSNSYYTFTQQLGKFSTGINTEIYIVEKVQTLYGEGLFYSFNDEHGLVWLYDEYSFRIEGNLSKEELLELQSSLIWEK